MFYPALRMRRLRNNQNIRDMVSETSFGLQNLIMPYFVVNGENIKEAIGSMPGIFRYSIDNLVEEVKKGRELGIKAVLLFGVGCEKDDVASAAYDENGLIPKALMALKDAAPDVMLITDVCFCEYTSHGHCGIILNDEVDNDRTIELLGQAALAYARAGADMVAPSDMMDGRVGYIRQALDEEGFTNIPILSYSAKYASAFYGPFREAADCAPKFGDRKTYQMDCRNSAEALREAAQDIEEGADIVMVKPALSYLDVICRVKADAKMPVCAYNVSGEYSMVKAAAANGWLDEKKIVAEILTSIKRAGADIIITYHANDYARWLKEGSVNA
ncbi:MAG: delta-aminolevulinic acid dehydratase [Candidatus Wallbacteria bacterium GWC2_49_35]|uniref:Delta-aminolevulinic acid dehydratase n=1 Tax=Candidatus Wallbacteria bacterium GWC2_49_35 TaxID=1817813 RepID=A0A1F7WNA9_9BACT|nr:MAG: delta-aminolevulinic acid dehydratase [Candidatus Wallbacteria bacterium GWC2_49_35]